MYSTRTRVHARIPNGLPREILARKSARVGQVGGLVGEDRRACPARGKLNGEVAGHADFRARILARVGEDVHVGVVAGVGPMEFQLYRELLFQRRIKNWKKHFERQWHKLRGRRRLAQHYYYNHAARPTPDALDARQRVAQLDVLPVYSRSRPPHAPAYDAVGNYVSRPVPTATHGPVVAQSNNCISRVDVRSRR